MIAAMKGHKNIISMLIQREANLNYVNQVSMHFLYKYNIVLYKLTEHKNNLLCVQQFFYIYNK